MASQVNYYDVLGIPRNASRDEVRVAYRNLAKERHPDHPSGSAEAFSLLQEAHNTLSDPNRRRQHDQDLDLAYAADQLSGLDFSSLDDEVAAKRKQRNRGRSSEDADVPSDDGPGFGERLRERFGRSKEKAEQEPPRSSRASGSRNRGESRGGRDGGNRRGRYEVPTAKWYEPQDFDPEPVTFRSGAISFVTAFFVFIVVGQIGLWATGGADPGLLGGIGVLAPFMSPVYLFVGLVVSYFAYRAAGYWAVALVFLAALVVGGSGGPEGLLQFVAVGILAFLAVIYFGKRRDARSRR